MKVYGWNIEKRSQKLLGCSIILKVYLHGKHFHSMRPTKKKNLKKIQIGHPKPWYSSKGNKNQPNDKNQKKNQNMIKLNTYGAK
jgi:hypothetical protein